MGAHTCWFLIMCYWHGVFFISWKSLFSSTYYSFYYLILWLFLKFQHYEGDVSDLELYFVILNNEYGEQAEEELLPGGKSTRVTNENVITFIHLVANHRLNFQVIYPHSVLFQPTALCNITIFLWRTFLCEMHIHFIVVA